MLQGLIAFPITPADADGRVDAPALAALVRRAAAGGADAVCVLGSTGTYAYLSREERRRAVETAAEALDGRTPLLAGVGALRTDAAVACACDAASAGAVAGLLAPVSYTPPTEDEVFAHFAVVAEEGGLPLCVYDNPAATHFAIGDELMARLAALPGVVASKSPAPSAAEAPGRVSTLRALVPPAFSVGFSVDWNAAEALIAGGDAWYSVLGGLFPAPLAAIRRAVADGRLAEARATDAALQPMWDLMREHSGLRVMYAAAAAAGIVEAALPRPLLPLAPAVRDRVAEVVSRLRPLLESDAA